MDQNVKQLALLQVITVEQLRVRLSDNSTESVMAAIMMLCYSEVISGRGKEYSWRLHLEGAASLLSRDTSTWTIYGPDRTRAFIAKCFVSLVAIANISGRPPSAMVSKQGLRLTGGESSTACIDDFLAYSSELVQKFFEIGTLIQHSAAISETDSLGATQIELRSLMMMQELNAMINRASTDTLDKLPPDLKEEYLCVNESYHHAAVLQIQLRVRRIKPGNEEIQSTVQRILNLISQIELHSGPCLGVVLYFPLFTAGCCSTRWADREWIQGMLQRMVENIGFANLQQGIDLLRKYWLCCDQYGESRPAISWEAFIGMHPKCNYEYRKF
jgi:hypothetical protein